MSLPESPLADLLRRVRELAEPDFIEPAQAYTVEERAGVVRIVSGENVVAPDLIRAEGRDNVLATGFKAGARQPAPITIVGERNIVFFGPHSNIANAAIAIEGSGNFVYFGAFSTAGQVTVRVRGDNLTSAVGDRSMMSNRIFIGQPDRRALFRQATGERLDPPADIGIGTHCWIGRDVMIAPGTSLGSDTIVGQSAVLRGHFPGNCVLVGAPARLAREGVTWARTSEKTYPETLASKHYKTHFLQHANTLKARIASFG